jgi:hypothetical protein
MNHNVFRTLVAGGFAAATLTIAVGSLAGPAAAAAATSPPDVSTAALAPSPQGIIMSDGRICNPRWGC